MMSAVASHRGSRLPSALSQGSAFGSFMKTVDAAAVPLVVRANGHVELAGNDPGLRPSARAVLVYLAENSHRYVSAQEVLRCVLNTCGDGGSVRNHIMEIRQRLMQAGYRDPVATKRRHGYRLSLPVTLLRDVAS